MKEVRFATNTDRIRTDSPVSGTRPGFLVSVVTVAVLLAALVVVSHPMVLGLVLVVVGGFALGRLVASSNGPAVRMPGTNAHLQFRTVRNCVTEDGHVSRAYSVAVVRKNEQ